MPQPLCQDSASHLWTEEGRGKKLIEVWRWHRGDGPKICQTCRKALEKKKESPKCKECKNEPPHLLAENAIAWEIWEWVHGQWRGGLFGGSLDYGAVEWISKVLGVEMNEDLLYKIRALEMIESGVENG